MKRIIYQPREFEPIKLESTPMSFYTPIQERKEQSIPVVDLSTDTVKSTTGSESKVDIKDSSPISFYMNYTNPVSQQQSSKIQRGTTTYKTNDIDVGNLSELISRFNDAGISLRVTSGRRTGATKQGNKSHHNTGDAIDITPGDGETYQSMRDKLKANSELTKWMQSQGWGIIDETNPEMKARTGATGDHWHIGKDRIAQSGLLTLLARNGAKIPIFKRGDKVTLDNVDRGDNEALNKYKGTKYDPLLAASYWHPELKWAAKYLNDWNIQELNDPEVHEYFKSYVNSPGYERITNNQSKWWLNEHPYKKYIDFGDHLRGVKALKDNVNNFDTPKIFNITMPVEHSFLQRYNNNVFIGTDDMPEFPYNFVLAHELGHAYNKSAVNPLYAEYETLNQNSNADKGHDSKPKEKHSDIWGLKYLLYKEGIYDSRSEQDVTPEQVKILRDKYPDIRPLLQMTDEETAWMLNHVASNNNNINLDNLG